MENYLKYRFKKVLKNILESSQDIVSVSTCQKYYLINVFVFSQFLFYYLGNKSTCSYAFNITLCHLGIFMGFLPYQRHDHQWGWKGKGLANAKVS